RDVEWPSRIRDARMQIRDLEVCLRGASSSKAGTTSEAPASALAPRLALVRRHTSRSRICMRASRMRDGHSTSRNTWTCAAEAAEFEPDRYPYAAAAYRETAGPDFVPSAKTGSVVEVLSPHPFERVGAVVSSAGDFNGDGFADIFVGGRRDHAYIVYGGERFYSSAERDLRNPRGEAIPIDVRAFLVEGNFDWNDDGNDDVLVGSAEGSVHVLFGARRESPKFVRGDADRNGRVDITDGIATLAFLFLGAGPPICLDAADSDDDGVLLLTDSIYLLSHLFLGGPAPPAPFPEAGGDATDDALDCRE
ncbi:MAG: hypothetical protein AAF517_08170, partial [Planctomycetota bacterium]